MNTANEEWIKLLTSGKPVVVAADNDPYNVDCCTMFYGISSVYETEIATWRGQCYIDEGDFIDDYLNYREGKTVGAVIVEADELWKEHAIDCICVYLGNENLPYTCDIDS